MKLTKWYPGHIKPARLGVYRKKSVFGRLGYQRWDGFLWYLWCETIDSASAAPFPVIPAAQNNPWQGLAEDPSESGPGGFFQSREALDMGKS